MQTLVQEKKEQEKNHLTHLRFLFCFFKYMHTHRHDLSWGIFTENTKPWVPRHQMNEGNASSCFWCTLLGSRFGLASLKFQRTAEHHPCSFRIFRTNKKHEEKKNVETSLPLETEKKNIQTFLPPKKLTSNPITDLMNGSFFPGQKTKVTTDAEVNTFSVTWKCTGKRSAN